MRPAPAPAVPAAASLSATAFQADPFYVCLDDTHESAEALRKNVTRWRQNAAAAAAAAAAVAAAAAATGAEAEPPSPSLKQSEDAERPELLRECESLAAQLSALEASVDIAAADPERYGVGAEELARREEWLARLQDEVAEARAALGLQPLSRPRTRREQSFTPAALERARHKRSLSRTTADELTAAARSAADEIDAAGGAANGPRGGSAGGGPGSTSSAKPGTGLPHGEPPTPHGGLLGGDPSAALASAVARLQALQASAEAALSAGLERSLGLKLAAGENGPVRYLLFFLFVMALGLVYTLHAFVLRGARADRTLGAGAAP